MTKQLIVSLTAILALLFQSCMRGGDGSGARDAQGDEIAISGTFSGGEGKKVVLEEMEAREFVPVDTVQCDDQGRFQFNFSAEEQAFYVLRNGSRGYLTLLCKPGETIEIEGVYGDTDNYRVDGSEGSELLRKLSEEHQKTLDALAVITRKNRDLVSSPDYPDIKARLDRQFDSITSAFRSYSLDFIHRNAGSLSILIALYNMYGQGLPVFQPETDLHVYRFVDSALMSRYEEFEAVKLLHGQVSQAEALFNDETTSNGLKVGQIAPDFVSSAPDGSLIALSDLRGDYVLLGFWAGWSSLSRMENAYFRKAYERYLDQPFRILQVSLDEDRKVWLSAIREDQLAWLHVSDLNRWESAVADLYHLEKIPSNVLVDPEGRIIDKNLFGDRLLERLDRIFSHRSE